MEKAVSVLLLLCIGVACVQVIFGSDRHWYPCPYGARGRYCRRLRTLQNRHSQRGTESPRPRLFPQLSDKHCYFDAVGQCFDVGESFEDPTSCNRCFCTTPPFAGCTRKACPKGCHLKGHFYSFGANFTDPRSCNRCTCAQNGHVICTLAYCPRAYCHYRRAVYAIGESWWAIDCCNTCHCSGDGEGNARVICTQKACD